MSAAHEPQAAGRRSDDLKVRLANIDAALLAQQVRFLPWVGAHYAQGLAGLRTLVLGESHYDAPASPIERRSFTRKVVNDWAPDGEPDKRAPYFRRLASWFGCDADVHGFMQRVVFYNYLIEPLATSAHRPRARDFRECLGPLQAVIEAMQPDWILVTGYGVWDAIPGGASSGWTRVRGIPLEPLPPSARRAPELWSVGDGRRCAATPVMHPSAPGLGAVEDWVPWIRASQAAAAAWVRGD